METKYPQLTDRIQSVFIDVLFIVVLMLIGSKIIDKYEEVPDWVRIMMFAGIWIVYEPLAVSLGCTFGQYIKGLRVRSITDTNKKINIIQSLFRYIIKTALGWISFLIISSNPQRRAIHDFAGWSVMIKK